MSIAQNILNSASENSDISSKRKLDEYFSSVLFDDDLWPFDFEKNKVKTEYLFAHLFPDRFGFSEELRLDIKFSFARHHYLLREKISVDDGLKIDLTSLIRNGTPDEQHEKFVYHLLNKHQKFISEYSRKNNIHPDDSVISIHAHSGKVDGVKTVGGYIWATYGFDFASEAELMTARKAFQKYAQKHNISISDKDLKYFKYPCHFAAFDTGQNIDGNPLGKAFLLQYEWYGVRKADLSENSELFRYQKAYHEKSKEAAKSELSKSFLAVLNKYKHQNTQKRSLTDQLIYLRDKLFHRR